MPLLGWQSGGLIKGSARFGSALMVACRSTRLRVGVSSGVWFCGSSALGWPGGRPSTLCSLLAGGLDGSTLALVVRHKIDAPAVTARKDDAPAADQAAIANVAGLGTFTGGGGLIQASG